MNLIRHVGACGFLIGLPAFAQGLITTLAGTGWFFPGNGRSAINAPVGRVQRLIVGPGGALYISDLDNSMVFEVDAEGILTIVAGNGSARFSGDNGPATMAALNHPTGIATDAAGNLYIADSFNSRIRKVSTNGVISTVAGTGDDGFNNDSIPATLASLYQPADVAVDSAGDLYIADSLNNRIRKVNAATGLISTVAGNGSRGFSGDGGPASAATLDVPVGLFIDSRDRIYIADNRRIRRIGTDDVIQTVAGISDYFPETENVPATQSSFVTPSAVAVDSNGVLYIADAGDSRIRKVGVNGIITTIAGNGTPGFIDGIDARRANLNQPSGVAVDAQGNIFIADTLNSRVRKVPASGIISTFAGNGMYKFGGDGGPASAALLNQPSDLVIDPKGNIYLSDTLNHRVRKIDAAGSISTFAGNGFALFAGDGGPAVQASLNNPIGLAVDHAGNVFIADSQNNRVRKVDPNGIITTAVGGGSLGEGAPAAKAALDRPQFLAFDAAGNLYITELQTFRVRKVSTSGIFTTFAGNGSPDSSGDGRLATNAGVSYSGGIAADSSGNIYFTEVYNGRVRQVTPNGVIYTYAGNGGQCCSGDGGPATNASLDATGLTVDAAGNLYISGHGFVRKVSLDGIISTVAGGGTPPLGSFGDGGSALDATLNNASGVRADASGDIFIADTFDDRIREVLNVQPPFDASPAKLSFTARSGAAATVDQSLLITSSVTNLAFNVTGMTSNGDWLIINTSAGFAPATIQVKADPINLPPGVYEGMVVIHAPDAIPALRQVNVKFSVAPASSPALATDPESFNFDFIAGLPGASQDLLVRNNGSGTLKFTLAASTTNGGNWLSVTPSTGSVTVTAPSPTIVTANPGRLPPGTYSGLITAKSAQPKQQILVPVTMTVHSAQQTIVLSQSGFTFSTVDGSTALQMDSFQVLNPGLGALNFSVSAQLISGPTNWLSVSPHSGAAGPGGTSPGEVDLAVNPTNLSPGDYFARVTIASPGAANSPQIISVVLTVAPKGTTSIDVRPTGLIFVGQPNNQVASQEIIVTNTGDSATSFRSTQATVAGPPFFSYRPTNGSLPAGQPVPISVQTNLQGLAPGVRRGNITLQFADGSTRAIAILLVIPGSTSPSTSRQPSALTNACKPSTLDPVFSALGQGFQVPASFPAQIAVKVVDDCGVFLNSGSVVTSFSNGDPLLSLVPVGNGEWTGTWQPARTAARILITGTATNPDNSLRGSVQISGDSATNAAVPVISSSWVVNSASQRTRAPVAPGSMITIYGQNLSIGSAKSGIPRSKSLNGTSVLIGAAMPPLVYVSGGQVNAIVPYNIPVNTTLPLGTKPGRPDVASAGRRRAGATCCLHRRRLGLRSRLRLFERQHPRRSQPPGESRRHHHDLLHRPRSGDSACRRRLPGSIQATVPHCKFSDRDHRRHSGPRRFRRARSRQSRRLPGERRRSRGGQAQRCGRVAAHSCRPSQPAGDIRCPLGRAPVSSR
jgi:sugar lactone lactonase YvrE